MHGISHFPQFSSLIVGSATSGKVVPGCLRKKTEKVVPRRTICSVPFAYSPYLHPSFHLLICPSLPFFLFSSFIFLHFIPSSTSISSPLCCLCVCVFVKLTQTRVIREEGVITEKMPTSDSPMWKSVKVFS